MTRIYYVLSRIFLFPLAVLFAILLLPVIALITLAALIFGKTVTAPLSALFIPFVMNKLDVMLTDERTELLKSIHGKVLDVGCAHGGYLKYYVKNGSAIEKLVMLEPNTHHNASLLHNIQLARLEKSESLLHTDIQIENRFLEDIPSSENGTFDWIILGNVMCEVPSPYSALTEVKRLLKDSGRVYFCEHIAHTKGTWLRWVQNLVNPWWVCVSDGCNINRSTLDTMRSLGWSLSYKEHGAHTLAPIMIGIAVKTASPDRH
jgi:SAM-dependent methyltransferase